MFDCILPIFCDPIQHNGDVSPERWDSSFYVHLKHKDSGVGTVFFLILQQNEIVCYINSLSVGIKNEFFYLHLTNTAIFFAVEDGNYVSVLTMDYYRAQNSYFCFTYIFCLMMVHRKNQTCRNIDKRNQVLYCKTVINIVTMKYHNIMGEIR